MKLAKIVAISLCEHSGVLAEELEHSEKSARLYDFTMDQVSNLVEDDLVKLGDIVKVEFTRPCGGSYQVSRIEIPRFAPKDQRTTSILIS